MIKNYLLSSWRKLMKHKSFSSINIFSLTVGMAACLVIFLFIRDETFFDVFHTRKDNLYRLCEIQSFPGTNTQKVALSMPGMAPTMLANFPEIKSYTRFWSWGKQSLKVDDKNFLIDRAAGVDSTFLQMFDFPDHSWRPKQDQRTSGYVCHESCSALREVISVRLHLFQFSLKVFFKVKAVVHPNQKSAFVGF